jgi:Sulfotransferase domain
MRIAMWSGPRNISTAMMRSFENREDCFVTDEPLYAHYLQVTHKDHPGADEVVAHHDPDWRRVSQWLTGPIPNGREVWYQKHMSHHLLPNIERDWLDSLTHAFLIRDPKAMLISLTKVWKSPRLEDTGLPQQVELFRRVKARLGRNPPVIDAKDVLTNPRGALSTLCAALGIPFSERMLSWPAGKRDTDGIWAKHWYAAVESSTGFEPWSERSESLPTQYSSLLDECLPLYAELRAARLS